jgi:hypothetical protein
MDSGQALSNAIPRCIVLSVAARDEVEQIAAETNYTAIEVTRLAYALLKVVLHHAAKGHKIVIEDPRGVQLYEIRLPEKRIASTPER